MNEARSSAVRTPATAPGRGERGRSPFRRPLLAVATHLDAWFWGIALLWTLLILALAGGQVYQSRATAWAMARNLAEERHNKDVLFRRWASRHGGVYAPMTEQTPPNPYLDVPEREVLTPFGQTLTLINPAYMTRQLHEMEAVASGVRGHITSLRPLRPANAPDDWERQALESFERGQSEAISLAMIDGRTHLRFMRPLIADKPCLKCHAKQGYREGDIRGGISVAVPWEPYRQALNGQLTATAGGYGAVWGLGLLGLGWGRRRLRAELSERKQREETLRRNEAKLESIFRAAPVGMGLVSRRIILEVNPTLCQMTGYSPADLCGRDARLLYLDDHDYARVGKEKYRQIAERGVGTVEVRWQRKDGEIIWIVLSSAPLDIDDLSKGVTFSALDISERKRAEERLAHLIYHDDLTRLPNRVLLTDRLQQAMAQSRRDQRKLAVVYLDLDGFKPLNDAWGHERGDQVLVEVARRLKQCVRAGDTVARLGGDEFVVLLGDLDDVEECELALGRVFAALEHPFAIAGQPLPLAASLGVTIYPDDEADPEVLLRHGDQAMYAAKQAGGHRYHWFDADYDRRARGHRDLLDRAETGLTAGEFRLHYQPKVDMRSGAVIGAEALIRWADPERGLLSPARFMSAIENSELAITVDRWVMAESLRQISAWAEHGLHLPVSVNVCGRHLQQPDFVARLQSVLAEHPALPADGFELEILETAALDDIAEVSRRIEDCRRLGVRFSLDDFGTGYSSLTYLKHLPVQSLKIDQSFVRNLLVDADAQAIVEGVIGLSVAFRREVIAEGVETDAHGCQLLRLGCNLAQGYGIARPMPAEEIPAWIAGWCPPAAWSDEAGLRVTGMRLRPRPQGSE